MTDDRSPPARQPGYSEPAQPFDIDDDPITTDALMKGRKEVRLSHRGEVYRLRVTSNGKLILHK